MDMAANLFMDQPVPGESLTTKSGTYPYENPPLINSSPDAMEYILNIYEAGDNEEIFMKMISAGITIEYLADVITKCAFMNGIFTVDIAEIIKPALVLQMLADARDAGISNPKIFNDAQTNEFSSDQYMALHQELRGEEAMMQEAPMEPIPEPIPEGSFLDMEAQ